MDFEFSTEQQMLGASLQAFLQRHCDFATRTAASRSPLGWRPELWRSLGRDLEVLGAAFPVDLGGAGGGPTETLLIMQALGAALVAEPYLEAVVMAGGVLRRIAAAPGASHPRVQAAIRALLAGQTVLVPAWTEPSARFCLDDVATTARKTVSGHWQLDGHKCAVTAAPWASAFIVTARTAGPRRARDGVSLFLVPRDLPGLVQKSYATIDGRRAADLYFDAVSLPADALLGNAGQALALVEQVADEAVAALCAEAIGVMDCLLQATLDHTRQRQQFGQPISSFQVLQHRMVDMKIQLEMARSATYNATAQLGADARQRGMAVSAAKVTVANACRFVGQNAVQLHGGMGMSDAVEMTHHYRRATLLETLLGTAEHHLSRFMALERQAPAPG